MTCGFCNSNALSSTILWFGMFILTFWLWLFQLCRVSLFLCLPSISLGRYCWKSLAETGGLEKKDTNCGMAIKMGIAYRGGFKLSVHYGPLPCFSILCIYFQMNSVDFAHNIWLQIVSLLALHPPNWYLHIQRISGIFVIAFRSLIFLCQTSWSQNCNQVMHVEQSVMGHIVMGWCDWFVDAY